MSGRTSRTKGHSYERAVAAELREHWPEARRGQQCRDGRDCADVEGIDGWHLELKRLRRVQWADVLEALAQAERDARPGRRKVVVMRKDRSEPVVCMTWEQWKAIAMEMRQPEGDQCR